MKRSVIIKCTDIFYNYHKIMTKIHNVNFSYSRNPFYSQINLLLSYTEIKDDLP